jgi:hypothetical protein
MRYLLVLTAFVFSFSTANANPICDVPKSKVQSDVKEQLSQRYGSSYSTIEYFLKQNMKAYETLCSIPDKNPHNQILSRLKRRYYPSMSTIKYFYQQDLQSYRSLDSGSPNMSQSSSDAGSNKPISLKKNEKRTWPQDFKEKANVDWSGEVSALIELIGQKTDYSVDLKNKPSSPRKIELQKQNVSVKTVLETLEQKADITIAPDSSSQTLTIKYN